MAKTRSGLGRGLGSLLGGGADGTLPQEKASPVERVVVENEKEEPKKPAPPTPAVTKTEDKPVEETKEESNETEVYSNKEDNITIKSVTERKVQPSVNPTPALKSQIENNATKQSNEIDIDLISPNPNQPRTNFKKEELEELGESIKRNGLLQPILVRKTGDRYEIIAGERRWQACKNIGLEKIPVHIKKMTQSEVAQAVSKGRSTIANALRLLELPEDAQQLLYEERITAGHARAILSVPTKEGRRKLTDKLVEDQLSVRETEAIARLLSGKKDEKPVKKEKAPKSYKTVARTLTDTLGTNVKIKSVKGKNKIEIEFKDEADLERLFRIMTNPSR